MLVRIHDLWAFLILAALVGCSESPPQYDPLVNYSPESLAAELSFRYQSLPPGARNVSVLPKTGPKGPVEAKKKEATKEALTENLGTVLTDIVAKSESIPGMTPTAARAAVADKVAQDPKISQEHKIVITEFLRQVPKP